LPAPNTVTASGPLRHWAGAEQTDAPETGTVTHNRMKNRIGTKSTYLTRITTAENPDKAPHIICTVCIMFNIRIGLV
jgi:hypothetical protein